MLINFQRQGANQVIRFFRQLPYTLDLIWVMVSRDFKLRYKRSILGVGWSLLNPLAQLAVFYIVFGTILPNKIPNFLVFLFSGIITWNWFQTSLNGAANSIVGNRNLIKRPGFPAIILPIVVVISNLINFLIALPALLIFTTLSNIPINFSLTIFPALIFVQFIFTLACSLFLAAFNVRFRDTSYLLGIFLRLMFFMTGIFFDPEPLISRYPALNFNPMLHIVTGYRTILVDQSLTNFPQLILVSIVSVLFLGIGIFMFNRARDQFVESL